MRPERDRIAGNKPVVVDTCRRAADLDVEVRAGCERDRPIAVRMPALAPGESVPPLAMLTAPTVPLVPPSVPALTVVKAEEAIEPLTSSVPALTVVTPV